jgi:hypothetical protein
MTAIKSYRHIRLISWLLAVAMILPLTPLCLVGAAAQPDRARTVLLFPVVDEANSPVPDLTTRATNALNVAISEMPGFECTEFTSTSPLVRRAVAEGRIRAVDAEQTKFDAPRALTIGHALQVDLIVLASIQSYRSTKDPRSVEIILSGQSYAVKKNFDAETDEPVAEPTVDRTFGVVGTSKPRAQYGGSEHPLMREAVDDAAYKAGQYLAGKTISQIQATPSGSKHSTGWLVWAAVIGLAAAVIAGSGGHGHGTSPGVLPPTNLVLAPNNAAIYLTWSPPVTTQTILFYQVFRKVDNSGFSQLPAGLLNVSPVPSAGFDPTHPSFTDGAMITGTHSYSYYVVAKYQNTNPQTSNPSNIAGPVSLTF